METIATQQSSELPEKNCTYCQAMFTPKEAHLFLCPGCMKWATDECPISVFVICQTCGHHVAAHTSEMNLKKHLLVFKCSAAGCDCKDFKRPKILAVPVIEYKKDHKARQG